MRPIFLLIPAALALTPAHPLSANPRDQVSGSFYFYDYKLEPDLDTPNNGAGLGQATLIQCQGKSQTITWGVAPYEGHCLTFTPAKKGDSISFKIHIAKVGSTEIPYSVSTAGASFGNEGIYQLLVDDQAIGEEHDCTRNDGWSHGKFTFVPGDYKITYRYVGPSPKSGASSLNLVRLEIQ